MREGHARGVREGACEGARGEAGGMAGRGRGRAPEGSSGVVRGVGERGGVRGPLSVPEGVRACVSVRVGLRPSEARLWASGANERGGRLPDPLASLGGPLAEEQVVQTDQVGHAQHDRHDTAHHLCPPVLTTSPLSIR